MKIAFSTLGCPDWSWRQTLEAARAYGYDGLSLRGVEGQMDLTLATPFLPENLPETRAELDSYGLEVCCLDTSVSFHDQAKREECLELGRRHLGLAARLGVRSIRVFGDRVPDGCTRGEVKERIVTGLRELAAYAEANGGGVDVLLETHGDFSHGREIAEIMRAVGHPRAGVLWDIHHPYRHDGETPRETFGWIKDFLRSTHIKDSRLEGGGYRYCPLGRGGVPILDCLRLLVQAGYDGWLVFEWEKRWHPELEGPEQVFPHYAAVMREMLQLVK